LRRAAGEARHERIGKHQTFPFPEPLEMAMSTLCLDRQDVGDELQGQN
jgi:hypothetical protein